MMATVFEA